MNLSKVLKIIFITFIVSSCGNSSKAIKSNFTIQSNAKKDIISNDEILELSILNPNNKVIDSVQFALNKSLISKQFNLKTIGLGENDKGYCLF